MSLEGMSDPLKLEHLEFPGPCGCKVLGVESHVHQVEDCVDPVWPVDEKHVVAANPPGNSVVALRIRCPDPFMITTIG